MLVLTRRVNDSIIIGNGIRIVVVEIVGKKVRLGVEAPKDVPVYRHELVEKILEQNELSTMQSRTAEGFEGRA